MTGGIEGQLPREVRVEAIRARLQAALTPTRLEVIDESAAHAVKRAEATNDYNQVVIALLQANGEIGKL